MFLALVGDGTPDGTRVVDQDTGEPVEWVVDYKLEAEPDEDYLVNTLTIRVLVFDKARRPEPHRPKPAKE